LTTVVPLSVRAAVQKISFGLFNLIFPENCRVCDSRLDDVSRTPVCPKCLSGAEPLQAEFVCVSCRAPFANQFPLDEAGRCALCRQGLTGFDAAYTFGFYEGTLRELITVFKYGRVRSLSRPLGEMLSRAMPRDTRFDVIVPMPMHWLRRWRRGFNQAALLARELSRRTGLPLENLVKRTKSAPPQAGLTSARRRANVAGAFTTPNPQAIQGRRVLLIDDVLTTGATAGVCARALKRAGAASVTVLTVARADRRLFSEPKRMNASSFSFQTDGESR
jgi:ComF family protein